MSERRTIAVRMFGVLRSARADRKLDTLVEMIVPAHGVSARAIALELELPLDLIEGVFVNHRVRRIEHTVVPGDRIAFVPVGTPGPHRFMLGLRAAGTASSASAETTRRARQGRMPPCPGSNGTRL